MKFRLHHVALATLVALGLTSLGAHAQSATPAAPASATSAPTNTLRDVVRVPLAEAQKLFEANNHAAAREKLQTVQALADKTAYESYVTARIALSVALAQDDGPGAAQLADSIFQLNATGNWLKPQETVSLMHAVGIAHYRAKDYGGAARWLDRTAEAGSIEASVRDARISSHLLAGNVQRGTELLAQSIDAAEKAGQTPEQKQLQLLYQARNQLKDAAGATQAIESLVRYYPSKEHWRQVLNRLWARADLPNRLQLDVFRLALYTQALDEATDFSEYVDFAQRAGFMVEALKVFDQGAAMGLIGTTDAHKKLRAKLAQDVEADRKSFKADLASAQKKPDGFALFNLGLNLVANQQFELGLDLLEKAITKGIAKNPIDAKLRLAAAYAQAGQSDKALQALSAVSGSEGIDELARYWKWALRKP